MTSRACGALWSDGRREGESERAKTFHPLTPPLNQRFAIDGFVYDLTPWLGGHPGGSAILIRQGGKDASAIFKAIQHSEYAVKESKKYIVGRLEEKAKL